MPSSCYLLPNFELTDSPFYSHAVLWALYVSQKKLPILCLTGITLPLFTRFHKIAKSDHHLRHVCLSVCPSVRRSICPHRTTRLPLDGFSYNLILEYIYIYFFLNCVEKIQFHSKSDKNNGYFACTRMYIMIIYFRST